MLLSLVGAALWSSCSVWLGTPMLGSCRYLPTVEECQATADRIESYCLRSCVVHLCRVGKPRCNKVVQLRCALPTFDPNGERGGWVLDDTPHSCEQPKEEFSWCELPLSPRCQALTVVHELAHACGWHHGDGNGVPGDDDGRLECR